MLIEIKQFEKLLTLNIDIFTFEIRAMYTRMVSCNQKNIEIQMNNGVLLNWKI